MSTPKEDKSKLKVKTTFMPTVELELADQAEYDYLASAGLLVDADNPKKEKE